MFGSSGIAKTASLTKPDSLAAMPAAIFRKKVSRTYFPAFKTDPVGRTSRLQNTLLFPTKVATSRSVCRQRVLFILMLACIFLVPQSSYQNLGAGHSAKKETRISGFGSSALVLDLPHVENFNERNEALCDLEAYLKKQEARIVRSLQKNESLSKEKISVEIQRHQLQHPEFKHRDCTMKTCFDHHRCRNGVKVYIYPAVDGSRSDNSELGRFFSELFDPTSLDDITLTDDPANACLLFVTLDTISRDPKHDNGFLAEHPDDIEQGLKSLPFWGTGKNHIVLVGYVGVYPSFLSNLDFDAGEAIVAMSSPSTHYFREGFDISLPHLPLYSISCDHVRETRPILGSFIGRRHTLKNSYGYWVSSGHLEREYVFSLQNAPENSGVIVHESCDIALDSCETTHNFSAVMCNSTFAILPPGRRPGTWRFVEAVSAGSIPVPISNDLILPFHELIPWESVIIPYDGKYIHKLASSLSQISSQELQVMKHDLKSIYKRFFENPRSIIPNIVSVVEQRLGRPIMVGVVPMNAAKTTYELGIISNIVDSLDPLGSERISINMPWESGTSSFKAILICSCRNVKDCRISGAELYARLTVPVKVICAERGFPANIGEPLTNALVEPSRPGTSPQYLFSDWKRSRLRLHGPHCSFLDFTVGGQAHYVECGDLTSDGRRKYNFVHLPDAVMLGRYREALDKISAANHFVATHSFCRSIALNLIASRFVDGQQHFEASACQPCRTKKLDISSTVYHELSGASMAALCLEHINNVMDFGRGTLNASTSLSTMHSENSDI